MEAYLERDIFKSGAKALVNPVNCKGVMGKGLALQFKLRFPQNFKLYKQACSDGSLVIGTVFGTRRPDGFHIINFPTKNHWKEPSNIQYIIDGLSSMSKYLFKHPEIDSVALPAIGCGLGGLSWEDVLETITDGLQANEKAGLQILLYPPK